MEKKLSRFEKIAITKFSKDVAVLSMELLKNEPEKIEFNGIVKYIDLLKKEAVKIRDGYYAKDDSVMPVKLEDISFDANLPIK